MNNSYRLEIHKWSEFKNIKLNMEQNSILWESYKLRIYAENYYEFGFLKERIIELSRIWNLINNSQNKVYPSFTIFNCERHIATVGIISPDGWFAPTTHFYGYLIRHLVKIYGRDNYREHLSSLTERTTFFIGIEWDRISINNIELVSENLFDVLLRNFLKEAMPEQALEQALEQELINRELI